MMDLVQVRSISLPAWPIPDRQPGFFPAIGPAGAVEARALGSGDLIRSKELNPQGMFALQEPWRGPAP